MFVYCPTSKQYSRSHLVPSARQELQDTLRDVSDHLSFLYFSLASLLNLISALKFPFNHAAQCQSFACVAPCGTAC